MTTQPDVPFPGSTRTPAQRGLLGLLGWVGQTLTFRTGPGASVLPIGYFANVVDLGRGQGLAISTDGVGTKLLIAQMLDRYDTIGIDCVAMNVNDILCVGAEPLALVDYLAVECPRPRLLEQIGKGLYEGARQAGVTIVGGELAEMPAVIHGERPGYGFELAGTCVGLVELDEIIDGGKLREGDVLIGLPSSGIHSNGLTLARQVLFDQAGLRPEEYIRELGRALGDELLEPTMIYVAEVLGVLRAGIPVHALAHVTGDGFRNLARVAAPAGYVIDAPPEPPPLFDLIGRLGGVSLETMYRTFNMGLGFGLAVPADRAEDALAVLKNCQPSAVRIGYAVADPERRIQLPGLGLILS